MIETAAIRANAAREVKAAHADLRRIASSIVGTQSPAEALALAKDADAVRKRLAASVKALSTAQKRHDAVIRPARVKAKAVDNG